MDECSAWTVLGLCPGATATQIRQAYRAKAKLVHPDALGSQAAFIELKAAFDSLYPLAQPGIPQSGEETQSRSQTKPASGKWITSRVPTNPPPVVDLTDVTRFRATHHQRRLPQSPRATAARGQEFEQLLLEALSQ